MLIEAHELSKSYPGAEGPVQVLDGVSLRLAPGETLAITGESGSGKSTLLHLLGLLDRPDAGWLRLNGQETAPLDESATARLRCTTIGLVFQQFNLVPALDVAANMALQARMAGRHDPARCAALAQRLGLDHLSRRLPEELSGGQQQRVAIGRALAARPALILADEPTGNLDEATAGTVADLLFDLVAETGAGLVIVTHSARLAARAARRLTLSRGRLA